jgi:hypothetical protein
MMLYIHWRPIWFIALAVALTLSPVLLMWQAIRKPLWTRIVVAVIATPIMLAGLGLTILFIFFASIGSEISAPIRSPNGARVARTETWGGPGSSGTDVVIYSLGGFLSSSVYSGAEESVANVRWLDDQTLEIRYSWDYGHTCDSTRTVRVICMPAETPSPSR